MSVEKKVPEIRFKGFSGEWKEKELKSFCDSFSYGLNASAIKFDDVNKYLRITDIDDKSRRFDYGSLTSPDVDISKSAEYLLKCGDVLFARTGASVGKTYLYNELDGKVFFAGFLIRASVNEKTSPQFIFQNTLTTAYEKFVVATSQRSGQPGINAKEYAEYRLFSPDEPEQTAIGTYFQKLDSLINQHQKQHDQLSNIKKSMLEKMFPKSGETTPEIRFKEFSGEWEKKKLGELAEVTMGQSPSGENYTNNPNDFILVQGNADLKNGFVVPRVWTSEVTKTATKGALIFSVRAPVGEVGKTNYNVVLGRGVAAINGNEFIYQQLKKLKSDNYWHKVSAGSTFDAISSTELALTFVWVSSDSEQAAIGNYFQKLDALINQHQQQITKLTHIKQAFLSKMFV